MVIVRTNAAQGDLHLGSEKFSKPERLVEGMENDWPEN